MFAQHDPGAQKQLQNRQFGFVRVSGTSRGNTRSGSDGKRRIRHCDAAKRFVKPLSTNNVIGFSATDELVVLRDTEARRSDGHAVFAELLPLRPTSVARLTLRESVRRVGARRLVSSSLLTAAALGANAFARVGAQSRPVTRLGSGDDRINPVCT